MSGSFIVTNSQSEQLVIEQLHINLWHLNKNNNFIDLGLNLYLKKEIDFSNDLIIDLKLPYQVNLKSSFKPMSLYGVFTEENIKLIFNNAVKKITTFNHELNNAKRVELEEGDPFFLLNPEIKSSTESNIILELNSSEICKIVDKFGIDQHFYFRIRYHSTLKLGTSVLVNSKFLTEKLFLDFRFNELRHIPQNELKGIIDSHIAIKNILIFLILPSSYKLIIGRNQKLKYIRLFEKKSFASFFPTLVSNKNDFIVYYWNILTDFNVNSTSLTSHDELFAFEYDKNALKKFLVGILSLLIIIAILNINTKELFVTSSFMKLNSYLGYIFDGLKAIFMTITLGALGSGLWDLGKYLFKKYRS